MHWGCSAIEPYRLQAGRISTRGGRLEGALKSRSQCYVMVSVSCLCPLILSMTPCFHCFRPLQIVSLAIFAISAHSPNHTLGRRMVIGWKGRIYTVYTPSYPSHNVLSELTQSTQCLTLEVQYDGVFSSRGGIYGNVPLVGISNQSEVQNAMTLLIIKAVLRRTLPGWDVRGSRLTRQGTSAHHLAQLG